MRATHLPRELPLSMRVVPTSLLPPTTQIRSLHTAVMPRPISVPPPCASTQISVSTGRRPHRLPQIQICASTVRRSYRVTRPRSAPPPCVSTQICASTDPRLHRAPVTPKPAEMGGFFSPSSVATAATTTPLPFNFLSEGKKDPEKGRYRPWDPGVFKVGGFWKPIPHPFDLIHDVSLKSSFSYCGWSQVEDECGYLARDDGSFVKSGYRMVKNLKDAKSSIPSTPSSESKQLNRIWKSIAAYKLHLSCLCFMFSSVVSLFGVSLYVCSVGSCISTNVSGLLFQ